MLETGRRCLRHSNLQIEGEADDARLEGKKVHCRSVFARRSSTQCCPGGVGFPKRFAMGRMELIGADGYKSSFASSWSTSGLDAKIEINCY